MALRKRFREGVDMGWCSATTIFDEVTAKVLESDASEKTKFDIIFELASALSDHDWDCESDSSYWDHPIVHAVMQSLHPHWEWDSSEEE